MLATLALMVVTARQQELTPPPKQAFQTQQQDFDKDVIEPLRQKQAAQAAREAAERAEAERQAQLALQRDLDATAARMAPQGTYGNSYSYRQCTWYVASRVQVPSYLGNATNWSYGLRNSGWREGGPRRGAVGVSHLGYAGHVVLVEQVSGDSVLISEYNWVPYSYTERWVSFGEYEWFFQ